MSSLAPPSEAALAALERTPASAGHTPRAGRIIPTRAVTACRPVPVSLHHRAPAVDTAWRCIAHGCVCEPTGCADTKEDAAA